MNVLRRYRIYRLPIGGHDSGSYVLHAHHMEVIDGNAHFYVVDESQARPVRLTATAALENVEAICEEESGKL